MRFEQPKVSSTFSWDVSPEKIHHTRASTETYTSSAACHEDLVGELHIDSSEYELTIDLKPSIPSDFADLFPSSRRWRICHDDTALDGGMDPRLGIKDALGGQKPKLRLFHLRMHDLNRRAFSLRRYEWEAIREVCQPSRRIKTPIKERPTLTKSARNAGDMLTAHIPITTTKLEFSNYAHVDSRRRGAGSSKRYGFETWGQSHTWKRATEMKSEDEVVSYHLLRNESSPGDHITADIPAKKMEGNGGETSPVGDLEGVRFRRHRRGRRNKQRVDGYEDCDLEDRSPFEREFQFRSQDNKPSMPGIVRLDSQCHIPLVVSRRWVIEAGRESEISTEFKPPSSYSLSGHPMTFNGIIRNVVFNPKGSSVTYRRDFLVSDQLDTFADFLIGAKFMLEQWSVLFGFGKMKRMIAGWFTHKRETPGEKAQAQVLKAHQERGAHEAELRRRAKKAQEAEEARKRRQEGAGRAQNNQ